MIGNPLRIEDIVSELHRGGLKLPEIQRNYVWRKPQVAQLLDSIYKGYPVGSILLWDTGDGVVLREMASNVGGSKPDFLPKIVLDGQQRITSLGKVFDPKSPKQDRVLFNVITEAFEGYSPRNAADPRWIDVTEILVGGRSELDVLDRLVEEKALDGSDKETRNLIHDKLKRITAIRKFQFPVEIIRDDDLEVVTEVFIRINSGGTRLREAELALARMAWRIPGIVVKNMQATEEACEERGFDIDSRFLMRALIAVATGQSRFRDLKAFWSRPAEEIAAAWKKTESAVRLALDFVEGNVGIPGSALLPSHFTLFPVVAVFSSGGSLSQEQEKTLQRWFLLANAFSRYVGSPETTLNQDLSALGQGYGNIQLLMDHLTQDLRGQPKVRPDDLARAGMGSPFFPLAYLAVIRNGATDWFRGIKIRRENFADDQNIEYHHIFPRKLLNQRGADRYLRDEMANIAFLGERANRRIRASEPKDYLLPIKQQAPERLEAQFVPLDQALWSLDRFEDFLEARRNLLAEAMNRILYG
jgi:hypothetical protein